MGKDTPPVPLSQAPHNQNQFPQPNKPLPSKPESRDVKVIIFLIVLLQIISRMHDLVD